MSGPAPAQGGARPLSRETVRAPGGADGRLVPSAG